MIVPEISSTNAMTQDTLMSEMDTERVDLTRKVNHCAIDAHQAKLRKTSRKLSELDYVAAADDVASVSSK